MQNSKLKVELMSEKANNSAINAFKMAPDFRGSLELGRILIGVFPGCLKIAGMAPSFFQVYR